MPPADHAGHCFRLLEDLEGLFDLPIDLVESESVDNPFFRAAIDATQQVLFE